MHGPLNVAVFTLHPNTAQANILTIRVSWDSSVSIVSSSQSHYKHY